MMKKLISLLISFAFLSVGMFAADVAIDAQFNVTGKDPGASYLTVKSAKVNIDKDQVDVKTGASKAKGTALWNSLRSDSNKKPVLSDGLQGLVKYPLAPEALFIGDGLNASKAADGTITIQYVHFGTAYKIVTDKAGKLVLPESTFLKRKIGSIDKSYKVTLSKDFAPDGSASSVNWAKVWDAAVAGGSIIVPSTDKTGDIAKDIPAADVKALMGTLQVTLKDSVLTIKGELNYKK